MEDERQEAVRWYENLSLEDAKIFIRQNIVTAARSFIAVGYYLKQVRDRELYREEGYKNIWEFAQAGYGISKSTASRFMAINDRFSQDGNSPLVKEEYRDFSRSQLQEMLYLTDDQLGQVNPEVPVLEIRQMRQVPKPDGDIPGQFRIEDFPEYMPETVAQTGRVNLTLQIPEAQPGTYRIKAQDMIGESVAASQQQEDAGQQSQEYGSGCGCDDDCGDRIIHHLKILPKYFAEVEAERKKFEIRKDDRNIQVGDEIWLEEFDGENYTGRKWIGSVSFILRNCEKYGLMDGFCIFCW